MTDAQLIIALKSNMASERRSQAEFLAHLAEVDIRRLYLPEHTSLFRFCTQVLQLSEASTSKRIQVARLSRRFPLVLALIGEGRLTMTNANLLAAHVTIDNYQTLFRQAEGKSKFEVEKLVASLAPKPDVPDSLRLLPLPCPGARESDQPPPAPRREVVKSLSERRTQFIFSGDDETVPLFRALQDRLRHKFPQGKLEDLVKEAFSLLLEKTNPAKEPQRKISPKPSVQISRYVSAATKRLIWQRDGGSCRQKTPSGRICESRTFLEIDHIVPFSLGGSSLDPTNLRLLCKAHNQFKGGAMRARCHGLPPRATKP